MLQEYKTILIPSPCGSLETIIEEPTKEVLGVAIILHPNPLYGGTNRNKVVQTIAKGLKQKGYLCYLPNLRGVGKSSGKHNFGIGEVDDVLSVIKYIDNAYPGKLKIISGFSFGGYVATKVVQHYVFEKIILVGAAVNKYEEAAPYLPSELNSLIIHAEKDEIISLSDMFNWARVQNLPVSVILDSPHFFHGKLHPLLNLVENFV